MKRMLLISTVVFAALLVNPAICLQSDHVPILGKKTEKRLVNSENSPSWKAINTGISDISIRTLIIHESKLYAANLSRDGIYRSADSGKTWSPIIAGMPDGGVNSFVAHGSDLFAGCRAGVFRIAGNDTFWTAVNTGLTDTLRGVLASNGTNLFADSKSVFLSRDNGASWTNIGLTGKSVHCMVVKNTKIFAGTVVEGVYCSADSGTTWRAVNIGLTFRWVATLAVQDTCIYVAIDTKGVYRLDNNSETWIEVNAGLTYRQVNCMVTIGTFLFAGTPKGVFVTANRGESWQAVNGGLTNTNVLSLAADNSTVYAGIEGNGVWSLDISTVSTIPAIGYSKAKINRNSLAVNSSNGCTIVSYAIRSTGYTQLDLLAASGKRVVSLVDKIQTAGNHSISIRDGLLPSGAYVVKLKAGEQQEKRMLLNIQ